MVEFNGEEGLNAYIKAISIISSAISISSGSPHQDGPQGGLES